MVPGPLETAVISRAPFSATPTPSAPAPRRSSTISVARHEMPRPGLARSGGTIARETEDQMFGCACGEVAACGGVLDFGRSIAVPQKAQMPWSPCIAIEAPHDGQ